MNKRNISVLPKSKSPHFFLQCRHHVLVKLVLWGPLTQMTPGGRFLPDHPLPQPDFWPPAQPDTSNSVSALAFWQRILTSSHQPSYQAREAASLALCQDGFPWRKLLTLR